VPDPVVCDVEREHGHGDVVGAQKVVPDLATALRRVEEHCLPLENDRAMKVYGGPSAVNRMLILNAEPDPGRGTVLLLRGAIGF
jgi:hypothetical protein